jgi:hypothetical protein
LAGFDKLKGDDAPSAAYAAKCRALAASPPPSWDGVWVAGEK